MTICKIYGQKGLVRHPGTESSRTEEIHLNYKIYYLNHKYLKGNKSIFTAVIGKEKFLILKKL